MSNTDQTTAPENQEAETYWLILDTDGQFKEWAPGEGVVVDGISLGEVFPEYVLMTVMPDHEPSEKLAALGRWKDPGSYDGLYFARMPGPVPPLELVKLSDAGTALFDYVNAATGEPARDLEDFLSDHFDECNFYMRGYADAQRYLKAEFPMHHDYMQGFRDGEGDLDLAEILPEEGS